jgi:cyclopropane fatty-acyl-phospholipid synthase-like methyltransferase
LSSTAPDDWDEHWDRYANLAGQNPAQQLRFRLVLDALKASGGPIPRLLDVGSGQGDLLAQAMAANIAMTFAGFELSESGVKVSQRKVPNARFVRADLFAPPAEAADFINWASAAVCSEVIEHVDDPVGFLQRLRTYLADGALLVLTVPGGTKSKFDESIGHRRHYTRASVREVLEQAGFTVEAVWAAGFPFFNLYRIIVILYGDRLIRDVGLTGSGATSPLARFAMVVFDVLFRFTIRNCPWGWQLVALARKTPA